MDDSTTNHNDQPGMDEGNDTLSTHDESIEESSQPTTPLSSSQHSPTSTGGEDGDVSNQDGNVNNTNEVTEEESDNKKDKINSQELAAIREKLDALIEEPPAFPPEETGFPEVFKGSVVIGKFIPITKRNCNSLEITAEDAILDCPSQAVPLLIKKPNIWPSKPNSDEGEGGPPRKKKKVTFADGTMGEGEDEEDAGDENKEPMEVDGHELDPEAKAAAEEKKRKEEEEKAHRASSMLTIPNYYKSTVGNMLLGIGLSRATEWFHRDAIKQLHRAIRKEGELEEYVEELKKQQGMHQACKQANAIFVNPHPYKCTICEFKSDSAVGLEQHMTIPHLSKKREYTCNYCNFGTRDPRTIVFHFQSAHNKPCNIEPPTQLYECPVCPYESSQKQKAAAHIAKCQKFFNPDKVQLVPDPETEYPAITSKPITQTDINIYQSTLEALRTVVLTPGASVPDIPGLPKGLQTQMFHMTQQQVAQQMKNRPKNVPQGANRVTIGQHLNQVPQAGLPPNATGLSQQAALSAAAGKAPQLYHMLQESGPGGHTQLVSIGSGSQKINQLLGANQQQPTAMARGISVQASGQQPGKKPVIQAGGDHARGTFVICEICDGYIRDLEQLRTHMQWIHKVKIHPKMLASRPPLNCQKCQWRFFTDQGLERHLLGAHGLVTSNMQDMVNQGTDGGRCTQCGRVFANKLVSHMSLQHKVVLKPAHLSYKCTVCSATFNLYRLFETHVYMVHSQNNKRNLATASATGGASNANAGEQSLIRKTITSSENNTANGTI